jgi:RNA polymerase sigma-70 factor (ECF subfamily)
MWRNAISVYYGAPMKNQGRHGMMFATVLQHETRPAPLQAHDSAPLDETLSERKRRFEQSVLPHFDAAYNLARWLTRNDHDAQDVVQEAVLRAYRFFDGLRGEAKPWLLTIVRNACFTWLQSNRPADTVEFNEGIAELLPADDDGPEVQAARNSDRRMLNAAIATLPAQFREVLILRELEDLSYKDIARIADVPIGTVMSRLARARRLLAESLRATSNISATQVRK